MPAFRLHGILVYFAAFKNQVKFRVKQNLAKARKK